MGGEWTIGARLLHGIVGALLGALIGLFADVYFFSFDIEAVSWIVIAISAAVCFVLGFFGGPGVLDLLRDVLGWD
jgi:hypothetical protein